MPKYLVSGHYPYSVEAATPEEAVEAACDKIGNGWEWEADPADPTPARPTAFCGCGFILIWVQGEWQHDAAPYLWGDDHDAHAPEPTGPAREYWDREDCVSDA